MQLSQKVILDAAILLLDEFGLGDITMRRLAKQLGVQPGAMYWHFPSKQALLAALGERIIAPCLLTPELPDPHHFESSLVNQTLQLRDCLLAHQDGAEVVQAAISMPSLFEQLHALFVRHIGDHLTPELAHQLATTVLHYTIGVTMFEQHRSQLRELTSTTQPDPETKIQETQQATQSFEQAIDMIITGAKVTAAAG